MALWKISECFFCAEKLENLASGKSAENLADPVKRKIWQAENLASGKSGKLDAENLRKVSAVWKIWKIWILYSCGESAEKFIDWKI